MPSEFLKQARQEIDACDQAMARLFVERMAMVEKVAHYKKEHALPIWDPQREAAMLKTRRDALKEDHLISYYQDFLQQVLRISKSYQKDLLDRNKRKGQ